MAGIRRANHADHTLAADNLAVAAQPLHRCLNSHLNCSSVLFEFISPGTKSGLCSGRRQRQLRPDLVSRKNPFQCVASSQRYSRAPSDYFHEGAKTAFSPLLAHHELPARESCPLEVRLLKQAFVLVRHHVRLNLIHEIHGHDHDDQQ